MRDNLIIILVLLGHIIGDFYAQTNNMAKSKKNRFKTLLFHGVVYALCMWTALGVGVPLSRELILVAALLGITHFLIDLLKYLFWPAIKDKTKPEDLRKAEGHVFIIDQCVHILSIAAVLWLWGPQLASKPFVSQQFPQSPVPTLTLLFGFLCVLKPVGMLFERGGILEPFKQKPTDAEDSDDNNAGKIIGYLERTIVFFFLLYKQFTAIAFVLTAKSIARFEMEKKKAEYYLIGTLFSVASVFVISFLLGLFG